MAQVEAPQEKLTPKQSNNLTSIWKAVVEASGGEFVSNDYIAVSDETRTTDSLPSVSVVDIPSDTPIVFDTDVLEQTDAEESNAFDEPVALEESQVEFVADEAAYRNPEAALETIRPIADYLAEHESVSLLLVGSTAGDITDESALRLSQARADAVKKHSAMTWALMKAAFIPLAWVLPIPGISATPGTTTVPLPAVIVR